MADYRPIFCVPGFASSRLTLTENVDGDVLWIDLYNMTIRRSQSLEAEVRPTEVEYNALAEKMQLLLQAEALPEGDAAKEEMFVSAVSSWWMKHMKLDPAKDWTTPDGLPTLGLMEGLSGIEYLDPHGPIMRSSTDVWATVVGRLKADGANAVFGAPYDWRLVPTRMGFEKLATMIEQQRAAAGMPVVVAAHSLGNRVTDYLTRKMGAAWCNENIHAWVSIAPPWLGAGKAVRGCVTGDDLGTTKLGIGLIDRAKGKELSLSLGSMPWMMPVAGKDGGYLEFNLPGDGCVFTRGPDNPAIPRAKAMHGGKADVINRLIDSHYLVRAMPFFSGAHFGSQIHNPPPVARLSVIYGTGLDTEYSYNMKSVNGELTLDSAFDGTKDGVRTSGGIRYETSQMLQHRDGTRNSGDGTVPYGSLTQHRAWMGGKVDITESIVAGASGEHLKIMKTAELLSTIQAVAKL